jgi:predicted ATPase
MARIRTLHLSNFRSLGRDAALVLNPQEPSLTVLAGLNGSGKSNVLDAFRFISDSLQRGLELSLVERLGFNRMSRWSRGGPRQVKLVVEVEDLAGNDWTWGFILAADAEHGFRVKREVASARERRTQDQLFTDLAARLLAASAEDEDEDGDAEPVTGAPSVARAPDATLPQRAFDIRDGGWDVRPNGVTADPPPRELFLPLLARLDPVFKPLVDFLGGAVIYSIHPDLLRRPQEPDPHQPMRRRGENWASMLQTLQSSGARNDFRAAMARIVPDLDDFRVTPSGGYLAPEFRHGEVNGRPRWLTAAQESDGTLRTAALLTALLQQPLPTLLGIEEPELMVHVGVLPLLLEYIEQAATQTQVILSTHSADLLDHVPMQCIRVVGCDAAGTSVRPLAPDQARLVQAHLTTAGALLREEGLQSEAAHG